jgi:SAM-dependent methyltransferase
VSRYRYVLLPGRHHLLTRAQAGYLRRVLAGRATADDGGAVDVEPDARVVWAVTSANHQNTRRNPVPYSRREAAIERFSATEDVDSLVVPVVDARATSRFARVTLTAVEIATAGRDVLTPRTTVLACSTPVVAQMYRDLGFRVVTVEDDADAFDEPPPRPWDVLELLVAGDPAWRDLAHPATVSVFDRYALDQHVRTVCTDPVVGDEGTLTDTREYGTYQRSFEDNSGRKWEQVGPYVRPGRIVDIGCASGGLLVEAGKDPRLHESDLIGVEVARHLFAEAQHRQAQKGFPNPNTWVYQRNILADGPAVFPDRSIDTTLTVALTHEISSYGDGLRDLRLLATRVLAHTAPGGVWVNSDVAGPADPGREVLLTLSTADGENPGRVRTDLADLGAGECAAYVERLSTRARLDQFAHDFALHAAPGYAVTPVDDVRDGDDHGRSTVRCTLAQAMEFLTRKDYTDNWVSECHERFTDMNLGTWRDLLTDVGFEVDVATHAWRNDWIVEHRIAPVASLADLDGTPLPWPDTHVLVLARRPLVPDEAPVPRG